MPNIDRLGRVVVPKELRRALGLEEGVAVEFVQREDELFLRKKNKTCVFCKKEEDLIRFHESALCRGCLAELKNVKKERD